jgi:hypothetical protein
LETPVLFLIFNRPEETRRVFEEIRKVRPRYLYIAADGPRQGHAEDEKNCLECRTLVLENADWDCQLYTCFRDHNLGCGQAVSSAINWFFSRVEEGIILEDDCLPDSSFFYFCATLLNRYRENTAVMHITGTNLDDRVKFGDGSYYYSNYLNIWGWATWRRAWEHYDFEMNDNRAYEQIIEARFHTRSERRFWNSRLKLITGKAIDTWDYQWMFSIWRAGGVSLNTNSNLVTNIGFNATSTHTVGRSPYLTVDRRNVDRIIPPATRQFYKPAELQFLLLVHGLKKRADFHDYLHTRWIQRFYNLIHKIQLKFHA